MDRRGSSKVRQHGADSGFAVCERLRLPRQVEVCGPGSRDTQEDGRRLLLRLRRRERRIRRAPAPMEARFARLNPAASLTCLVSAWDRRRLLRFHPLRPEVGRDQRRRAGSREGARPSHSPRTGRAAALRAQRADRTVGLAAKVPYPRSQKLGYNEKDWPKIDKEWPDWDNLSEEMQEAAEVLGGSPVERTILPLLLESRDGRVVLRRLPRVSQT